MIALLLALVIVPAPRTVTLYDDVVKVGAAKIRTLDVALPEEPARIICTYEVTEGGSGVRVVLLRREDAERWLRGEAHHVEAATAFSRSGAFSHLPLEPDHYQIVLDNRLEGRGPAEVHLLVRVVYGEAVKGPVRAADPRKGRILVWSSMALFACVALLSATKLKRSLDAG